MNKQQLEEMRPHLHNLHRQVELMLHFATIGEPQNAPKLLDNIIANVCALQMISSSPNLLIERMTKALNHIAIGDIEIQPFKEGDGATVSFNALYPDIASTIAFAPVPREIRGVKKG